MISYAAVHADNWDKNEIDEEVDTEVDVQMGEAEVEEM